MNHKQQEGGGGVLSLADTAKLGLSAVPSRKQPVLRGTPRLVFRRVRDHQVEFFVRLVARPIVCPGSTRKSHLLRLLAKSSVEALAAAAAGAVVLNIVGNTIRTHHAFHRLRVGVAQIAAEVVDSDG